MLSLYEILKASKTGIAPDMWTALAGMNWGGADSGHEVKELTGIPPLSFTADGTPLLDYLISGNMSQTGTPTPDNPVDVNGVGERTANIFDGTLLGGYFLDANFELGGNTSVFKSIKVFLPAGTYTFSWGKNVNIVRKIIDGSYSENLATNVTSYTVTSTTDDHVGISFRDTTSSSTVWDVATPIMLNTGSTAKPYEPYGYKIPISNGQQTTNIYLGSTQTTRQIKKLVLTGEGNFGRQNISDADPTFARFSKIFQFGSVTSTSAILYASTHFTGLKSFNTTSSTAENCFEMRFASGTTTMMIVTNAATTATSFNQWLADQYAAGTPVTVWYVLATTETATVNEPLMKIGTYADTLSMEQAGVSIPTLNGQTVVDVETTLKPSQMYIKYQQ